MAEESKLDPLKGLSQGERLKRYVMEGAGKSEEPKLQPGELTSYGQTKSKQLQKCPMYCRSNCANKHHPLLVALLNCKCIDNEAEMKRRLDDLHKVVQRYQDQGWWNLDDEIPDSVLTYRYPMIHWAAALGHLEALKWLLNYGMNSKGLAPRFGSETALHKALLCLQETSPINCFEKFEQLVSMLEDTLPLADQLGNTVLHTCCEYLANEIPKFQYFQHCLLSILYHYRSQNRNKELCQLVEMQNQDGNTCLHILCQSDKCCMQVRSLLRETSGENLLVTFIRNSKLLTPIEVAGECGASTMVHQLKIIMKREEPQPEAPAKQTVGDMSGTNIVYDRKGNVIGEKLFIRPVSNSYQSMISGEEVASEFMPGSPASDEPPKKMLKVSTDFQDSRKGEVAEEGQEEKGHEQVLESSAVGTSVNEPRPSTSAISAYALTETGELAEVVEEKGTQMTRFQTKLTKTEPVKTNQFFVDIRKYPGWSETEVVPMTYDQITPIHRQTMETLVTSMTKSERDDLTLSLRNDLENLLKKYALMSTTEEDLSSKYELLQDQQMKLVLEVQKLLHKLTRLKKEERALLDSIHSGNTELTTTQATHQGLKERLQHCNAALKVLEEIQSQADEETGSSSQGTT